MGSPYFFIDLFLVFVPVIGLDIWYIRGKKSSHNSYFSKPIWGMLCLVSSVTCTLFNFPIFDGVNVNLSIVSLTLAFFLLPWMMGLLVLFLYIIAQITLSMFLLGHGNFTAQVAHTVLMDFSHALVVISIYALMMSVCFMAVRNREAWVRAIWFVVSMLSYTIIDYMYMVHAYHFQHFEIKKFAGFVLLFNVIFILTVHLLVHAEDSHAKRIDEVRAQKLELISQLSASVAHEIRNPLTVVRGYTKLMINEEFDRDKSVDFLQSMLQELDRAESVISDYLQIGKRPDDHTMTEIQLSQAVDHVIDVLSPYALNNSVELKKTVEKDICVYGISAHVTQAIMNLVKNAIEANDQGGKVEVILVRTSNTVELKISDTGRGIAKSMLSRLGEPYYSTKTHGTGLGLTLVYKVINDMSGKIQVQSQEGKGTMFKIFLPVYLHANLPEIMTQSRSMVDLKM